jgi:hypothetical protein
LFSALKMNMNNQFPVPPAQPAHGDEAADNAEASVVTHFENSDIFPEVTVVLQEGSTGPPPVDGEDTGHDFIIKRRKLSYLGNILRSWQTGVIDPTNTIAFPAVGDVESATASTSAIEVNYMHDRLQWRSSHKIKVTSAKNILIVRLANDGYLYITPDADMQASPWSQANKRHPSQRTGWSVIETSHRDEAWRQLSDFSVFANAWFGPHTAYHKYILYNAEARRVNICFLSKESIGLRPIALEFSFEPDWPVADESELWC